ncbi:hypothetical protein STCU_05703 [Strigomonas culicis]|uniref:Uncharacterized protein n=1 Tax=Strigomonas culicis TaxID=28005 RepID=S9UF55_9TRYP|nr:hypothetical protein STCU_05703 [Strigomonas culicis]|eukprot:EPY27533.1 hypothetical protein STCU_05703 [Strigomonas culicis]
MLRFTSVRRGTLVKLGRGIENITEAASNSLLESLQHHGYCYVQHPFIQRSVLDQLQRDCRIFFEQYILHLQDAQASGNLRRNNKHNYHCTPLSEYELEGIRSPSGFRGYYRYVGASGLDDAIDCFSIGREDEDPAALRRDYYQKAGWEESEYLPMISRRNPWDVLLNHVNVMGDGAGPTSVHMSGGTTGHVLNNNFMSDFRDMMVAYYELCSIVSLDVMRHISCGLGIRPSIPQGGYDPCMDYDYDFFTPFHSRKDFDLQAKYYPRLGAATRVRQGVAVQNAQSPQNPDGVRVLRRKGAKTTPLAPEAAPGADAAAPAVRLDTHKDLSTITLLSQDAVGGPRGVGRGEAAVHHRPRAGRRAPRQRRRVPREVDRRAHRRDAAPRAQRTGRQQPLQHRLLRAAQPRRKD